jgi:uncharacterized membrane protein YecN with MAPEG domain
MTTAILCIALLAALLFVLGWNVSRIRGTRGSTGDQFPTAPDDALFVAIRAHGNATEYVPTLAILILVVGSRDPAVWMLVVAAVATFSRYLHAVGVLVGGDMGKENLLRLVGAVGTILSGVALAVAAVLVI